MARKNRVSVPDGTYHVTSRIVNREMWLGNPGLKDEIVSWIYGIAAFSGVDLLAWAVLDNHFHLVVHVPSPPESSWSAPGDPPEVYAFGMRPAECRSQIWSSGPDAGDCPRSARPATGFSLSDEEMLERLRGLYGDPRRVEAVRKAWDALRARGDGTAVEEKKERYCRRMYNLSQFVKTLKERVAQAVNRRTGHVGHVFEGRFYSGLLEDDAEVRRLVSLYVDFNPCKAGLVGEDEDYRWSSFGEARGDGPHAASCRAAYERIWDCPWAQAREQIEAAFHVRVADRRKLRVQLDEGVVRATVGQLVHLKVAALSRGAFIGRSVRFGESVTAEMTRGFPRPSFRSLAWLQRAVDWPAGRLVA